MQVFTTDEAIHIYIRTQELSVNVSLTSLSILLPQERKREPNGRSALG